MVLSSDCISVAMTVQIVTSIRTVPVGEAAAGNAMVPTAGGVVAVAAMRRRTCSPVLFLLVREVPADLLQHAGRDPQVVVGQAGQRVSRTSRDTASTCSAMDKPRAVGTMILARRSAPPSCRSISCDASSASSKRTTDEPSSASAAARSFWRIGTGARAR